MKLTTHETMHAGHGATLSTTDPFQWEVRGLPRGLEAFIWREREDEFRVMMNLNTKQTDWQGPFGTFDLALAEIDRFASELPLCRDCGTAMTFVEPMPYESYSHGTTIHVALESAIYRCPEHGEHRVFINGRTVPYARSAV